VHRLFLWDKGTSKEKRGTSELENEKKVKDNTGVTATAKRTRDAKVGGKEGERRVKPGLYMLPSLQLREW